MPNSTQNHGRFTLKNAKFFKFKALNALNLCKITACDLRRYYKFSTHSPSTLHSSAFLSVDALARLCP